MSAAAVDSGTARLPAGLYAVYRMFDADGSLLYIGRAGRGKRLGEHSEKFWFFLVTTITLERYDMEPEAAAAETAAIRAERPRYNRRGLEAPKRKPWRPAPEVILPVAAVAVPDVLSVFEGGTRLHWQTIIDRLAERFPNRWADATVRRISAQMQAVGVPSASFREPGSGSGPRYGCRRADVQAAVTRLSR